MKKVLTTIKKFFKHEHEWLDFFDEKQRFFKQGGHPAASEHIEENNVSVSTDESWSCVNSGYYDFCNCGAYKCRRTGEIEYFKYNLTKDL